MLHKGRSFKQTWELHCPLGEWLTMGKERGFGSVGSWHWSIIAFYSPFFNFHWTWLYYKQASKLTSILYYIIKISKRHSSMFYICFIPRILNTGLPYVCFLNTAYNANCTYIQRIHLSTCFWSDWLRFFGILSWSVR